MTTLHLVMLVPLVAMMLLAAVIDGQSRRIPNWLSFPMLLTGVAASFMSGSIVSPWESLLGLLAGFGLTFLLFAMGAMGGGDVKLLSGVGAWVGAETVLYIFIIEAVIGMVIVLCQAAYQGRLRVLARNTAVVAINLIHVNEVGVDHATETGKNCRSVDRPLPYAVPTLIATLLVFGLLWRRGI